MSVVEKRPGNQPDGGEAILEALRNLRIEYVISSPGSEWPPVWEAFARQKVSGATGPIYLDCGHETLAVGIAAGYTRVSGRMQAVLLHAGSGLLQGSMGIQGALASEIPMLIMSGESLTYGESPDFDPGNQWYRNLGVVGGPQRLAEPVVKWAHQVTSSETLYHSVIRAGEMAQRVPQGPVYLNVPCETMLASWTSPKKTRQAAGAPKLRPLSEDIAAIANLLIAATHPVILTEAAGRDPQAFIALVELAELMAIPVIEGRAAAYANFPKSHPLHQGSNVAAHLKSADVVLLIESRVPWYPPSNSPAQAKVIAISENPLKGHMTYQNLEADSYLEGDAASTIRLLIEALETSGETSAKHKARHDRWAQSHDERAAKGRATQASGETAETISTAYACKILNQVLPPDTIYVDETIVHSPIIRELLVWNEPGCFQRTPSGLGQGLGIALGAKLAARNRPVVMLIGDGSFLYNPVLPFLTFSKDQNIPILVVIFNNNKYEIMRHTHINWYPESVAAQQNLHYGVHIENPDYSQLALWTGGVGRRVTKATELFEAISSGYQSTKTGNTSIINMMVNE